MSETWLGWQSNKGMYSIRTCPEVIGCQWQQEGSRHSTPHTQVTGALRDTSHTHPHFLSLTADKSCLLLSSDSCGICSCCDPACVSQFCEFLPFPKSLGRAGYCGWSFFSSYVLSSGGRGAHNPLTTVFLR